MTDLTADEMHDRILRSLKANSAEFERKWHILWTRRVLYFLFTGLIFLAGLALGLSLKSTAWVTHITEIFSRFVA